MILLNQYDLRQIILIEKKIILFEEGKLDLFEIIRDLGRLLNVLESVPNLWKDDFQNEINNLEMIYIGIEDGSVSRWKENYQEDMHHVLLKLKKMAGILLGEYLEKPDLNILETAIEEDSNWFICPKCKDAWESDSLKTMIICPNCECALHNPRIQKTIKSTSSPAVACQK
jgi:hypothetical protein